MLITLTRTERQLLWVTLLSFQRQAGGKFEPKHEDTLKPPAASARRMAEMAFHVVRELLGMDAVSTDVLPPTEVNTVQTGVTCGLHVIAKFQERWSQHRGDFRRNYLKPTAVAAEVNRLVSTMTALRMKAGMDKPSSSSGTGGASGSSGTGGASGSTHAGGADGSTGAGGASGNTGTGASTGGEPPAVPHPVPPPPLPPPPVPQEALESQPAVPMAFLPPTTAGCGRCRQSHFLVRARSGAHDLGIEVQYLGMNWLWVTCRRTGLDDFWTMPGPFWDGEGGN